MRVGKTPQAILAASKLNARRSLVICPAIAVQQWYAEWYRWWNVGYYGAANPGTVEVYSYDKAKLNWSTLTSQRWDVTIVDEAHFAKNPEAARTKLIYGKGGLGWCSDRLWALSGTPAPKHAGELWPMLFAFGVVTLSYDQFIKRYCRIDYLSQRPVGTREERIPELKALLAKVMLRRMRKEVAPDMPAIGFGFLNITPTSKVDLPAGTDVDSAPPEDRQAVALAKVGPLSDEIDFALANGLYQQTVVFGHHVEPLESMARSLRARGWTAAVLNGGTSPTDRELIQQRFRAGDLQVVCANIATAGTAIDLSAASHGYFLELDWVPGNNVQAANRLVSMQKSEPVTVDVVTWPGSVDDRVQKVLLRRARELAKLV
jgi:SWI/SNF-related matrix-associated actin-dependent regulator 1 of chromatin subfamily A